MQCSSQQNIGTSIKWRAAKISHQASFSVLVVTETSIVLAACHSILLPRPKDGNSPLETVVDGWTVYGVTSVTC